MRQNLSIYLDRVKRGEALTVTEHGTAVAILKPLARASTALDRLVAEGLAVAPRRDVASLGRARQSRRRRRLTDDLDESREERI